jgi:hypothetical protein
MSCCVMMKSWPCSSFFVDLGAGQEEGREIGLYIPLVPVSIISSALWLARCHMDPMTVDETLVLCFDR